MVRDAAAGQGVHMDEGGKRTVMLVEDEAIIRMATAESVRRFGYEVVPLSSGELAVARAAEGGIDLVLMDIDLGAGMAGPEAARRIMELGPVPVVFLSSHAEREMVERVRGITRYGYVIKNSGDFVLRSSIEMAFELFGANTRLEAELEERRRAEASLVESERRFRSIVQASPLGMHLYRLDPGRGLVFEGANPAADLILGTDNAAFKGKSITEAFPPLAATEVPARYAEVARDGGIWRTEQVEYRDERIEGAYEVVAFQTVPGSMAALFSDITVRKRAEEDLRRTTLELEEYFQTALDLFCMARVDGEFIKLNRQWEVALGHPVEELLHRNFLDFVHPDDREPTLAAVGRLEGSEEVRDFVNRYRRRDGSYRWIEWRAALHGGLIYAAARDITERMEAEARIRALLDEKELILREVHHRVKNNMALMTSLLTLQASLAEDAAVAGALEDARGRLQSMGVLYERLYRSEDLGAMSVRDYLSQLLERIVELFPESAHIGLERRIQDFSLGVRELSTLGIVVNELITNSMKYAFAGRPSGTVTVEAASDGARARVSVGDDGVGLPASLDPHRAQSFGLRLVGALTEQLGGTLALERGGGTRFTLDFPVPAEAGSPAG